MAGEILHGSRLIGRGVSGGRRERCLLVRLVTRDFALTSTKTGGYASKTLDRYRAEKAALMTTPLWRVDLRLETDGVLCEASRFLSSHVVGDRLITLPTQCAKVTSRPHARPPPFRSVTLKIERPAEAPHRIRVVSSAKVARSSSKNGRQRW